jgi:hypothetical protein
VSNKNKHNSIVFLTTLSVYLGLVLVGGALSPVLAQAAMTRTFNVQDEIEIKDDLDKKPNDESVEISSVKEFPILFIQLLSEVRAEIESGKYSTPAKIEFDFETGCFQSGLRGSCRGGTDISDSDFYTFVGIAVEKKFKSKIFVANDLIDGKDKGWRIQIKINDSDLSFKASFTKSNAELFAESVSKMFLSSATQAKDLQISQVYENSKATFENNQVFIVTRLPRGSLDELLKNAKAESE